MKTRSLRLFASLFGWRDETLSEEPLLQAEAGRPQTLGSLDDLSWWSFLTFSWVSPIVKLGAKRQLDNSDLFPLPKDMSADACCSELFKNWEVEKKKDKEQLSLLRAILTTYGRPWLVVGIVKAINDSLSFAGPFFLNEIVNFLDVGDTDMMYGYLCAAGLGLVSAIRAFLGAHYTFLILRLRLQVKASITTIVYQKALCVSLSERTTFSTGEIQTFMSVDAERIATLVNCGHEVWSLPLQMAVALWMLYMQVKFAFVAGLGVIILLIPVNSLIVKLMCSANESMMKEKDERVRRMGELLMYIRTLKMYTWEHLFLKRVMHSREQELKYLGVKKYLDACCVYFWACTPTTFSLLTFGLFVLLGYKLTAATVFTSLALFNILITPLNSLPWVINGIIEGYVSLARIRKFLSCSEIDPGWTKEILCLSEGWKDSLVDSTNSTSDPGQSSVEGENVDSMAIMLENAAFAWSHSLVENPVPIISQISLAIPTGSLVVILGKVGSGKSSLLEAMLGEMRCIQGSMIVQGRLAYVPQSPWIQAGTLCDNILFGQPFVPERYKSILEACALDVDIQQMQGGDLAEIGERGVNLSGGQRARLALARALYQDCDTYLFDDPLSAVDAHVAVWLLKHAIAGPRMLNKTRSPLHPSHSVMDEGRVSFSGRLGSESSMDDKQLQQPQGSLTLDLLTSELEQDGVIHSPQALLSSHETGNMDLRPSEIVLPSPETTNIISLPLELLLASPRTTSMSSLPIAFNEQCLRGVSHYTSPTKRVMGPGARTIRNSTNIMSSGITQLKATQSLTTKLAKLTEEESRTKGHVQGAVYRAYGGFVNWGVIATILISISLMQATRNGSDTWLAHWVDIKTYGPERNLYYYLKVYALLGLANSILTLARAFSLPTEVCFRSIHYRRFLPFVVNNLIAQLFSLIGITVVLCWIQWTFIVALVPLVIIYDRLQRYYRATSRELRRLDGVTRSPIYTSFTETLDGASTIRASRAQAQFAASNREKVDANLKASFSEISASLWLSIRLQILAAVLVFFISLVAIYSQQSNSRIRAVSAGLVGLGLSYASPIITTLNNLLAQFTDTEKDMVSMERIQQYMDLEAEPFEGNVEVSSDWPTNGEIEFSKVTLTYRPYLPPALRDLSFTIQAGEQVGIAGRTGAGKSSILSILFRLTTLTGGKISIDGIDTATVPLQVLRSRLSVVPQTPMLFEGTLRQNLNPTGNISDEELWTMLEKCHMKEAVQGNAGLDLHVSECGESLSLGQRQLLCLARALLSCSKILCLDECTANIDPETTTLLMETVVSECKNMTVLTIAHRIATILDMDRVIIMDQGSLIEEGKPKELLADPTSKFSALVRVSGAESD